MDVDNTLYTAQKTLDGTAQQLIAQDAFPYLCKAIKITNVDTAADVYWGITGVTALTGDLIPAGTFVTLDFIDPHKIYVIGTNTKKISFALIR